MITIRSAESPEDVEFATNIQLAVFSDEQGIPVDICRQRNDEAQHMLAYADDVPVATARLIIEADGQAEIARVAVLPDHRGNRIGARLVIALEDVALRAGVRKITLHPHRYLQPFYASLGYSVADEAPDIIGGHELITMVKQLAY